MLIQKAIELFNQHQKSSVKLGTLKSYGKLLEQFQAKFSEYEATSVSSEDISRFLEQCTGGLSLSHSPSPIHSGEGVFQLCH